MNQEIRQSTKTKRLWEKGAKLDEEVLLFTSGEDPIVDIRLIEWDAIASAAHAKMLYEISILSKDELDDLLRILRVVYLEGRDCKFAIPLELEDCHTAIESYLVNRCGYPGKKIHTGRSRNDQVLVAMRLYLRNSLISILSQLGVLVDTMLARSKEEVSTYMPGYTHLQIAMPSSVGMWIHAFAEALTKEYARGLLLLNELNTNPLGSAAGFGVPIPIDRQMTTELLAFSSVQWNPIEAQNSRGRYELIVARFLGDITSHIEKLAWDFSIYTTSEFGFVSLPEYLTTGSSIMPQKRNPDVVELVRARASRIRGRISELEWVIAKLPSNYHRDFQYTKAPVFAVIDDITQILPIVTKMIREFSLNADALSYAMKDEVYATYDAFIQVRQGVPFRDAYLNTAQKLKDGNLNAKQLKEESHDVLKQVTVWITDTTERLEKQKGALLEWKKAEKRIAESVFEF